MQDNQEPIIPLFPTDDFHKLLFALKYVDELKRENSKLNVEIGLLKSDYDFLVSTSADARKLVAYLKELKDLRAKVRKLQE